MRLALETATDRASVAIGDGTRVVERDLTGARRHAAGLIPLIVEALQAAGGTLDDVRTLVLSDGPGSFTGLRVGASVAKALVQARGLPLWTAPSLMVRRPGVAPDGAIVLAVANALRGELYAAAYRFERDHVATAGAVGPRPEDSWPRGPSRMLVGARRQPDSACWRAGRASRSSLRRPARRTPGLLDWLA